MSTPLTLAFLFTILKSTGAWIQNKAVYHYPYIHGLHPVTITIKQKDHFPPRFSSNHINEEFQIDSRIQRFMSSLETNQDHFRALTLLRILVPSLVLALVTYIVFPPIVHTLTETIRTSFDGLAEPHQYGPAALNLILTDNSNQFIQNIHNFCGLLFSLLTAHTFGFLIKQQETLYTALFEELSTVQSLLEQLALVSEGRPQFYQTLLSCVYEYLEQDLVPTLYVNKLEDIRTDIESDSEKINFQRLWDSWMKSLKEYDDVPALMISSRPMEDSLETILYLTSVGEPSHIYSTVRSLRQARSKRLGALQLKMPDIQMSLLNIFGFMVLCTFPVIATGAQTVGGEGLIQVQRIHLSIATFGLGCVLGIVHELRRPGTGSAYNIDYSVLKNLMKGLHAELQTRLHKSRTDLESSIDTEGERAYLSISTSSVEAKDNVIGKRKRMVQSILEKLRKLSKRNDTR